MFRRLFAGRPDVFPVRWENRKDGRSGYSPACSNEWAKGICGKPKVKCGECPHQAFIPASEDIIEKHLRGGDVRSGDFVAGVYPLLQDETCWFLAADFDKESWADDTRALLATCRSKGISAALERSRSGNGGHVWIFFCEPIPARIARQLGAALITETMENRPEIGFTSYDRFFPNQDTMPLGGFGNLIAFPLQRKARENDNSVFVETTCDLTMTSGPTCRLCRDYRQTQSSGSPTKLNCRGGSWASGCRSMTNMPTSRGRCCRHVVSNQGE